MFIWRTRLFIFILTILMNSDGEPLMPPKNTDYLHKRRHIGVSVCECGYIARSTQERDAHECNVSRFYFQYINMFYHECFCRMRAAPSYCASMMMISRDYLDLLLTITSSNSMQQQQYAVRACIIALESTLLVIVLSSSQTQQVGLGIQ